VSLSFCYQTVNSQILKSSLAVFIAEVLHHALKEEQPNEPFFDFLEAAFEWLDNHEETANFHLIFLLQATRYLGFYPDTSEGHLSFFDLKEGCFSPNETLSCTSSENTELLQKLLKTTFDTESRIFSNLQRKQLLSVLLDYYQLHLDGFVRPRSVEVFQEVFAMP
jgi:DNA repair protein RecO (recombination protein O)